MWEERNDNKYMITDPCNVICVDCFSSKKPLRVDEDMCMRVRDLQECGTESGSGGEEMDLNKNARTLLDGEESARCVPCDHGIN